MEAETKRSHPIWSIMEHQGRSLKWLARKTGYSYAHAMGISNEQWTATTEFRARCAQALDLPESILFIDPDPVPPGRRHAHETTKASDAR